MGTHFGPKVVGHEAYDKAVRSEAGGGNVFGTRVRDAIPESGPTNIAKRASEFGVAVIGHADASDNEGTPGDTVSVDQLRNILAENPTFFDSLYEAELAREEGPREDALAIFYEVERGIKGQMRADVMQEIRGLMGHTGVDSAQRADQAKVRVQQQADMAARTEENRLLEDAPRIRALRDRANDLKVVKEAQDNGDLASQVGFTTEQQETRIAGEQGITLPSDVQSGVVGRVPAKPDGDTHTETQSPGNRLGVPKGDSGTADGGSSAGGSSPATGGTSDRFDGDRTERQEKTDSTTEETGVDPETQTKAELEDRLGPEALAKVKGTGADGAVLKADLVKAVKKAEKSK